MPTFVLIHRHEPGECRTAYAAWTGFESPLRRTPTLASCVGGRHRIYWVVSAVDERAALAHLPEWVAQRSDVSRVEQVEIA